MNAPQKLNARIESAALIGLTRKIAGIPTEPFYCLKFVRLCVEYAMGLRGRGFYSLVSGVDSNPTAHELDVLLRAQRPAWVQQTPLPGDLVFWNWIGQDGKNWGHTGIVVRRSRLKPNELWVAQNTMAKTGVRYGGALAMIPLADMGTPRTIIRIGA